MPAWSVQRVGNELVIEGCGEIDPHLLTILLRYRPEAVLPFTLIQTVNRQIFVFDVNNYVSLGQYIHLAGKKASGRALLISLLEAIQSANEHLLWPDPELTAPGLFFLNKRTRAAHFIALPVAVGDPEGVLCPLLDTIAKTGDFSAEGLATLRAFLAADDYLRAIEWLLPKSPPAEKKRATSPFLRAKATLLSIQHRIEAQVGRRNGKYDDREWEQTEPLEPEDGSEAIGILSEGLPGTKEEEAGEKAFILVDEFLVGRDSHKVDFQLKDERCGRVHARISRRRNLFFLEDLGSANGTILDGMRLPKYKEVMLPEQAKIQFGNLVYYFSSE